MGLETMSGGGFRAQPVAVRALEAYYSELHGHSVAGLVGESNASQT